MAQTVASQEYLNLTVDDVLDPNYNRLVGYWRSVKVFRVAYAGYDQICPQLYNAKEVEYTNAMKVLYRIPNPNPVYLATLAQQMDNQMVRTIYGIKRMKGHLFHNMPMVQNVRVVFTYDGVDSNPFDLDMNSADQTVFETKEVSYPEIVDFRVQNSQIKVRVIGDNWVDTQGQLSEFTIGYQEISADGFEDWFYFGRGLHLLIKIVFQVSYEPGANATSRGMFHVNSIFFMLSRRLYEFNRQHATIDKRHNPNANKSKMSYIRKRVDPTSETAFWSTGTGVQQVLQRIRTEIVETGSRFQGSQIGDMLGRTVKFVDFQVSVYFEDEYEDTVCVCSEWCNWNAFFRFNPMYRFLMVNHAQLYMHNLTNIADMYLFCAASMFHVAHPNPNANPPVPRVYQKLPFLNLITQPNEYRNTNYQRYFMTQAAWEQDYMASTPTFESLNAMAHKLLTRGSCVARAIRQSSPDPFSDVCCQNLINYYKVLSDLHSFISTIDVFVDPHDIREWFKEVDAISRDSFAFYMITCYEHKITLSRGEYDFVFSEDLEYRYVFIKSPEIQTIKSERDRIYQFAQPINRLNVKFNLERMVSTYVSLYKTLTIVEPMVSVPRAFRALRYQLNLITQIDDDFQAYYKPPVGSPQTAILFDFYVVPDQTHLQGLERNYYALYTLKLYSIAFGYQKYCITWFMKFSHRLIRLRRNQISPQFRFIWKYKVIEQRFRTLYQPLFTIGLRIRDHIDDFYTTFWGPADHETNAANATFGECITSGLREYSRLHYWWRNNGDNRGKFARILDVFVENQISFGDQTRQIFREYILGSVSAISGYPFQTEVMDHLVYYLVKAFSSMILNSVVRFMKPLHRLQVRSLVVDDLSYTLSKPGWVPLFRTMNGVFQRLDQIKQSYIIYDDENNRISNAISETKQMIKDIYREFYLKLISEWTEEIFRVLSANTSNQNASDFLCLHLASGLSFVCAFVDQFREHSLRYRKEIEATFRANPNPNLIQHVQFHACEQAYKRFQKSQVAIQEAKPFLASHWVMQLYYIFQGMHQIPYMLGIDMNSADIFI